MTTTGGTNYRQKLLHDFTIDFNSVQDGRRYKGKFVTRKLSISDLAALGVRKSQLNGGMHYDSEKPGMGVDEETDGFNNMIAHLDISLVEVPDWWDLSEITDIQLLSAIFQEVIAHENTFLRRGQDSGNSGRGSDNGSEGSSSENTPETNDSGGPATVVGQEVQSALEP